jgi:hypothetical protein
MEARQVKEFVVPLKVTIACDCVVEAETETEARAIALRGTWIDDTRQSGELVDWDVAGSPMVNE